MLMRAATVVQVLYVLLQLLVVAAIFIASFILLVIAPLQMKRSGYREAK